MSALIEELKKPKYTGKTAEEAYESLKQETLVPAIVSHRVDDQELCDSFEDPEFGAGIVFAIKTAAENSDKFIFKLVYGWLIGEKKVDLGNPKVRAMLTTMVPSVLTQEQSSALLKLAERKQSVGESIGLGRVQLQQVKDALFEVRRGENA